MRVTLKTVNNELAGLGAKTELAKGAGYFLFRGGEAEEWIERTVRVPTISSLTMEQWVEEYKRLKTLNQDMVTSAKQAPAREEPPKAARTEKPPRPELPAPEAPRKEACSIKPKLLDDLDKAHKGLVAIEDQQVRAAREDRVSDLSTLSLAVTKERGTFDRALLAIRDHILVHGC